MYVLEVRNAELIESLTKQAAEQGITYAAIVALIGAIDSFTVSTNPADDAKGAMTVAACPAASLSLSRVFTMDAVVPHSGLARAAGEVAAEETSFGTAVGMVVVGNIAHAVVDVDRAEVFGRDLA